IAPARVKSWAQETAGNAPCPGSRESATRPSGPGRTSTPGAAVAFSRVSGCSRPFTEARPSAVGAGSSRRQLREMMARMLPCPVDADREVPVERGLARLGAGVPPPLLHELQRVARARGIGGQGHPFRGELGLRGVHGL